ncbi:MAG: restriction endonuclease subunit S [Deltaproteobacteria bacterium]|nr:restriction endonuclease subunit S [Deltaproteobacteria bacterium]
MGEIRGIRIGDVARIKHGFAFDGQFFFDEPSRDVLVTPGNFAIGGGFKLDKPKFYRGPVEDEYVLAPGDVVVTMTDLSKSCDTLGFSALIPPVEGCRFLHNQRIGRVEVSRRDLIDERYLYWLMRGPEYRAEILAGATGTTVRHTAPGRIESFRFTAPPLTQQRAIAHILGTLDDKIELNRRMNETLEAMARALFKSWFVDFDPVRAKAEGRQPIGMDAETAKLFPSEFEQSELGEIPKGVAGSSTRRSR